MSRLELIIARTNALASYFRAGGHREPAARVHLERAVDIGNELDRSGYDFDDDRMIANALTLAGRKDA